MRKLLKWGGIAFVALLAIGAIGNALTPADPAVAESTSTPGASATTLPSSTAAATPDATERSTPTAAPTATPEPTRKPDPTPTAVVLTRSQENAIRKAEDYLSFTAFSRSGLIDQLEFEGFIAADATFAVDWLDVDWREQAWHKAEEYLEYSAFSRAGLIAQLEFEGFTHKQAVYGVNKTGL
jgi:hypothetical protein